MSRFLALAISTLCISGFAQNTKPVTPSSQKSAAACEKRSIKNPIPLYEIYDNQGSNLGVRGDVLYMNYTSPVLTFASERELTGTVLDSNILGVPGKMSLGCNVAVNYTMHDQPGYTFESSWYHIVAKYSRNDTSDRILLAHSLSLTTAAPGSVNINAHIAINLFDFLVQKNFSFGNWFTVMPSAGLVGGYMDSVNKASTQATGLGNFGSTTRTATLEQSLKFQGIGIKLGGKSSFKIWDGFRLTADLFYSVMYGHSHNGLAVASDGSFGTEHLSGTNVSYKHHHGRCFFDSLLGLAWENRFCNDSVYLDLHAGWKFQSFSDGWMEFEAEFDDAVHTLPLYGQGLQAGATFRF